MDELGTAAPIGLRLFIEGLEIPVISASVSAAEGAPANAQVEIVPTPAAMFLAARSKVLLFFLDPNTGHTSVRRSSTKTNSRDDMSGYGLLFSGELVSISYSKTGYGSRSIVLQCMDDSNCLDSTFTYMMRYSSGGNVVAGNQTNFYGLNENGNPFDDIISSPEEVIRTIIMEKRALSPNLAGRENLLGGVLSILEIMGGVAGKYIGVSGWSTVQEARVRLLDQIAADDGATASALFDMAAFEGWLTQTIGDAGTVISFRTLVDIVCSYIYYSVAPNPVGHYVDGSHNPPTWTASPTESSTESDEPTDTSDDVPIGGDPAFKYIADMLVPIEEEILAGLRARGWTQAVQTDGWRRETTPSHAHYWGLAIDNSAGSVGLGFDTRKPPDPDGTLDQRLRWHWVRNPTNATSFFTPAEISLYTQVLRFYRAYGDVVREINERHNNILEWGGSWMNAGKNAFLAAHGIGWDPVHVQLSGWKTYVEQHGRKRTKTALLATTAEEGAFSRLQTQFVRPDIWFAAPPACNIIFPEEVSSLSYNQNFLQEVTRLQLSTFDQIVGNDTLINSVYFAPKFADASKSLSSGGLGTAERAVIYPHEATSGIVPKMEHLNQVAFYSRLSSENQISAGDLADIQAEEDIGDSVQNQMDLWADRTALFNFLSYRYSARQLSVAMRFTPRITVGFPAVVVDRTYSESGGNVKTDLKPNHFLGMVRSVSHSISQGGATTHVSMSHVRLHRPELGDEFAAAVYNDSGLLAAQRIVGETTEHVIQVTTDMDQQLYDWLVGFVLLQDSFTPGMIVPGPYGGTGIWPECVTISTGNASAEELTVVGGVVGGATSIFRFESLTFREDADVEYVPIEEALRPPWVDDAYRNERIGELYQRFFGCGSIFDVVNVEPSAVGDTGEIYSMSSIADAVEKIVAEYSQHSDGGYSADSYIHSLTTRPFASIGDILGYYDKDGNFIEGFFTQSMGDKTDLSGSRFEWMKNPGVSIRSNPSEVNKVDPRLDARATRFEKVRLYFSELQRSFGLRG